MSEEEFIDSIKKHAGIINKVIFLYLNDMNEKEDLSQEIQLQAWKAIGRFRGDSQFSTWLYRVALNTVFTYQRKKKIHQDALLDKDFVSEEPQPSDRSELLLFEIKRLSPIDKMIITLHLEDYDNGEIASITGLSKNNLGVKLHRIKELLKKKLNPVNHE